MNKYIKDKNERKYKKLTFQKMLIEVTFQKILQII